MPSTATDHTGDGAHSVGPRPLPPFALERYSLLLALPLRSFCLANQDATVT